ncbi:UDP-glycosyltransferase UGT5-like isoform X1 [Lycorma delicatula]|uniref:UDP-glycosyltransferase UGT5-like isoform X1 n=1 Tax=Lycorma delicatula TaxID=130591 RepID=UPI003F50D784
MSTTYVISLRKYYTKYITLRNKNKIIMLKQHLFNLFLIILIDLLRNATSARILGIFPIRGVSHYKSFEILGLELVTRGHELVVINNFPQNNPVKGFTDIDVSNFSEICTNSISVEDFGNIPTGTIYDVIDLYFFIHNTAEVFKSPQVIKLINNTNNENFDLIITEMFNTDMFLGFAYKYNAPIIGFTFSTMMPWIDGRFGNPNNPSYIPCLSSQYYNKMDFFQRVSNSLQTFISIIAYKWFYLPLSELYAKKYFGHDLPPLDELVKQSSLIFFNGHRSIHGSRPLVPGVIEVGGLHIRQQKKIPQDLEKFINESSHGVIYFCMGSMLKASTLPEEKRLDLIEVFSKLPQRVLWKWETETMPDKPDNVKLLKWMPQRDVLAHPNIKIFISHGGLLGTTEAVYSGVPIIGMPFYGDQAVNVEAVQAAGAGIRLDFKNLNKETLENAIRRILDDPKYKENAKQLSERFRDRPQSPLETAIYWTEYVIRHKGAPHLRSAAVDLTWYQYLLLDVVAFIIFILIVTVTILYYSIKFIYNLINKVFSKPQKNEKRSKHKDD